MQPLASFILRGWPSALALIVVTAVIAWLFPPLFILSCAGLALVVLRQADVIKLVVVAVLLLALLLTIIYSSPLLAITTLILLWLPVMLLARVLRRTQSQTQVLIVLLLLALLFTLSLRLLIGDVDLFWRQALTQSLEMLTGNGMHIRSSIDSLVPMMTSMIGSSLSLVLMSSILLARWWQSQLFNPGGFRQEFLRIEFPRWLTVSILISFLLSITTLVTAGFLIDFAMIGASLLMFQGLAVVHYLVGQKKMANGWLFGLYIFLVFASVYVISLLAMLAIADSFSDYRKLHTS